MKRNFNLLIFCIIFSWLFLISCPVSVNEEKEKTVAPVVEITDKTSHYEVVINYNDGTPSQVGTLYGEALMKSLPEYEQIMDSYISYMAGSNSVYNIFMNRTNDIKSQLSVECREELDAIASKCCSAGTTNTRGDNKLSINEFYYINLIVDVTSHTQCSVVSVFGNFSGTGKPITGRNLEWPAGSDNQIPKIQSVTTIKRGNKSFCSIGFLGFMGIISAVNDNGIFSSVLLSLTGGTYQSSGKSSISFDLRYALENYTTINSISDYMTNVSKSYTIGHLVYLSDSTESKIVENDISSQEKRRVRIYNSELNAAVEAWPSPLLDYSIGAVNSFVLNGNDDNHSIDVTNTARWSSIINELSNAASGDSKVSVEELKNIMSFDNGDGPGSMSEGDLYVANTQQIIIFQSGNSAMDVYFRPKTGTPPDDPVFETINIKF